MDRGRGHRTVTTSTASETLVAAVAAATSAPNPANNQHVTMLACRPESEPTRRVPLVAEKSALGALFCNRISLTASQNAGRERRRLTSTVGFNVLPALSAGSGAQFRARPQRKWTACTTGQLGKFSGNTDCKARLLGSPSARCCMAQTAPGSSRPITRPRGFPLLLRCASDQNQGRRPQRSGGTGRKVHASSSAP